MTLVRANYVRDFFSIIIKKIYKKINLHINKQKSVYKNKTKQIAKPYYLCWESKGYNYLLGKGKRK